MSFYQRFCDLCSLRSKKPTPVLDELKISRGSLANWRTGATPSGTTLAKLADYFDVSIEYLLGLSDEKKAAPGGTAFLTDYQLDIAVRFNALSDAQKEDVRKYIDFLTSKD